MKVAYSAHALCVAALLCLTAPAVSGGEVAGLRYPGQRTSHTVTYGGPPKPMTLLAQAQPEPVADPAFDDDVSESDGMLSADGATPWEEIDPASCDTCGGDCGDQCCSTGCMGGLWYGSVDYLLFRPRMSQAVGAVRRQETTDTSTFPSTSTLTDNVIEYPFRYQSGFRVAAGYRLLNCGGDFQVAYWRMAANASVVEGPANTSTNNPFIAGNLENNPSTGQYLEANTGVTANIFDVSFAKCISMGGPTGPCDPCFCPRWDVRFLAGARVGDISRYNNNVVTDAEGTAQSYGNINARFVGAGPRFGLQTRRYLGCRGRWSVYANAAQSILIGEFRQNESLLVPTNGTTANSYTNQNFTFSRTVPVSDIELGLSWQAAPYTYITAGYFWQCWWDLGQGEQINGTNFGLLDTSNILGFDGFFVRGEMLF